MVSRREWPLLCLCTVCIETWAGWGRDRGGGGDEEEPATRDGSSLGGRSVLYIISLHGVESSDFSDEINLKMGRRGWGGGGEQGGLECEPSVGPCFRL